MRAPKAELNEFVIQLEPGVEIRVDKDKRIVTLTPKNVATEAGKDWTVQAGENAVIKAGNNVTVQAGGVLHIKAPEIIKEGNETARGTGGSIGTVNERAHREHGMSPFFQRNLVQRLLLDTARIRRTPTVQCGAVVAGVMPFLILTAFGGISRKAFIGVTRFGMAIYWGSTTSTSTQTVSASTTDLEYLRQIPVTFTLEGFGPGEILESVKFDGVDVTDSVLEV